jgi:hypothetical protein
VQRAGRGSRRGRKTNLLCLLSAEHGSITSSALTFAALLSQVQAGHQEREPPRAIYGAAAQQLLSLLLEGHGAYRPLGELAEPFAAWPHLERPVIEQILEGLAAGDFVRRHPVLTGYGAGEQLHRLRDLHLNWGNFPLQSRDVKLTTYGRDLGTIPGGNVLALLPGDVVYFAGRRWRVQRVARDAIQVEPSDAPATAEIVYPHAGLPLDAATVEEMLGLLATPLPVPECWSPEAAQPPAFDPDEEAAPDVLPAQLSRSMARDVRATLLTMASRLRPFLGWDRLPVVHDEGGEYCYVTFAGAGMNRVLGTWAGAGRFDVSDIVLRSEDPIDFAQLPAEPEVLATIAGNALRPPDGLTLFQMALPPALLAAELADLWRKTPVFARSLARLRQARPVRTPWEALEGLGGGG